MRSPEDPAAERARQRPVGGAAVPASRDALPSAPSHPRLVHVTVAAVVEVVVNAAVVSVPVGFGLWTVLPRRVRGSVRHGRGTHPADRSPGGRSMSSISPARRSVAWSSAKPTWTTLPRTSSSSLPSSSTRAAGRPAHHRLHQVARHKAIAFLRRRRDHAPLPDGDQEAAPGDAARLSSSALLTASGASTATPTRWAATTTTRRCPSNEPRRWPTGSDPRATSTPTVSPSPATGHRPRRPQRAARRQRRPRRPPGEPPGRHHRRRLNHPSPAIGPGR